MNALSKLEQDCVEACNNASTFAERAKIQREYHKKLRELRSKGNA